MQTRRAVSIVALAVTVVPVDGCRTGDGSEKRAAVPAGATRERDTTQLQAAIDRAGDGEKVEVAPGIYRGSLRLKDGVTVVAARRGEAIIVGDASAGPVVTAEGCRRVRVEGLCLRHDGALPGVPVERLPALLHARGSGVELVEVTAERGAGPGFHIEDAPSALLMACTARGNARNGFIVKGVAAVRMEGCVAADNGNNGIVVGDGCGLFLAGSRVTGSGGAGVLLADAGGTVVANVVAGSRYDGIRATGSSTVVRVLGNTCADNVNSGIAFVEGAGGAAEENLVLGSKQYGLWVGSDADLVVRGNASEPGESLTLWVGRSAHARVEDNAAIGEDGVTEYYVLSRLADGDFAALEAVATRLRSGRARYTTGGWPLDWFYRWLSEVEGEGFRGKKPPYREALERWAAASPRSPTPRIALAEMHAKLGWLARGTGFAKEVTPEGWKGFREELARAQVAIEEARALGVEDPMLHASALWVGLGLGRSDLPSIFDDGKRVDRTFYPLYDRRLTSLLPRWGGTEAELSNFLETTAADIGGSEGNEMYALLAERLLAWETREAISQYAISRPRIHAGLDTLVRRFPRSIAFKNLAAHAAVAYGDWPLAAEMFDQIGEAWDAGVWQERRYFDSARAVAQKKRDGSAR